MTFSGHQQTWESEIKMLDVLKDLWYRLSCRLWYRYNVVVCHALPPTWVDRDYLLLYAAFQILEDFVLREEGHFHEDVYALYLPECGEKMARLRERDWQELRFLYQWWQQRKHAVNDYYHEDTMMLHRLIDIRKLLWT